MLNLSPAGSALENIKYIKDNILYIEAKATPLPPCLFVERDLQKQPS